MKLTDFLRDKKYAILLFLLGSLFVSAFLLIFGIGAGELALLWMLCALLFGGGICCEYVRQRKRIQKLLSLLYSLDQKYLIAEIADKPENSMEKAYFCMLKTALKAMTDEVSGAQRLNREYREFIEQWVHEIKVPITGIELLCENNKTDVSRRILSQTEQIEQNVERALFYARLGSVEKDYLIREISLRDCVLESLSQNRQFLIQNSVCVNTDSVAHTVCSDEKWVVFILNQLLVNSVKYRSERPCKIEISSKDLGKTIQLTVTDNGIGIKESEIGRVFDKGFTGSNGRAAKNSTGIGLYLCRQLCMRLGLEIAVTSQQGLYTTVSLSFPKSTYYHVNDI